MEQNKTQLNMDLVADSLLKKLNAANQEIAILEAKLIQTEQYAVALQNQLEAKEEECKNCELNEDDTEK